MTLAEALDTTHIPRVAGRIGARTAFVTAPPVNDHAPRFSLPAAAGYFHVLIPLSFAGKYRAMEPFSATSSPAQ